MPTFAALAELSDIRSGVLSEDLSSSKYVLFASNDIVDEMVQGSSLCTVGNGDCNDFLCELTVAKFKGIVGGDAKTGEIVLL